MKRKTKNILMIVLLTIMLLSLGLTFYSVKNIKPTEPFDKVEFNNGMGTPPERPNNNIEDRNMNPPEKPDGEMQEGTRPNDNFGGRRPEGSMPNDNFNINSRNHLSGLYYLLFGLESLIISIIVIYLIMSKFNKKTFKETFKVSDKLLIFVLLTIIMTSSIFITSTRISNKLIANNSSFMDNLDDEEKIDLDKTNEVNTEKINLSDHNENVTITKAGTYEISGEFDNSVIVDVESGSVNLILNNVTINSKQTSAIIGLSGEKLVVSSKDGTTNTLNDSGNTEYDGALYGNIPLVIEGEGKLIVNGKESEGIATTDQPITINSGEIIITSADDGINTGGDNGGTITINGGNIYIDAGGDGIDSNKDIVVNGGTLFVMGSDVGGDSGIDADQGYVINGGNVVALGSDMIETPKETSKQKVIAFSLNEKIEKDIIISLLDIDDDELTTFVSTKSFKTIIISSNNLKNTDYTLYKGGSHTGELFNGIYLNGSYKKGEKINISNNDSFTINKTINLFK